MHRTCAARATDHNNLILFETVPQSAVIYSAMTLNTEQKYNMTRLFTQ